MSNIQKAFKTKAKRGLCMAVGGVLDPAEQNSRPIAAPTIQGDANLIQNPTAAAPQWSGGFKSMDHDPMADMNSLSPTNPASAPNPAYGGRFGNDPHFSASTSRVIQDRNLGRPTATGSGYTPAQRNAPAPNLMVPVDQLFQERRGLGMADGGVVAETPEQVMARMAAKYGVSAAPAATPNPLLPRLRLRLPNLRSRPGVFFRELFARCAAGRRRSTRRRAMPKVVWP